MYVVRLSGSSAKFIAGAVDCSYVDKPEDRGKFFVFGPDTNVEVIDAEQMEARFGPPYNVREIKVWEFDFPVKEEES